jgi:hypothetical protein
MDRHVSLDLKLSSEQIALRQAIGDDVAARIETAVERWSNEALRKALQQAIKISYDRSVSGFCRRWGISRFLFYDRIGEMPAIMHVGGRTLISPEAEATWIKQREAAAITAPKRCVGKVRRGLPHQNNSRI